MMRHKLEKIRPAVYNLYKCKVGKTPLKKGQQDQNGQTPRQTVPVLIPYLVSKFEIRHPWVDAPLPNKQVENPDFNAQQILHKADIWICKSYDPKNKAYKLSREDMQEKANESKVCCMHHVVNTQIIKDGSGKVQAIFIKNGLQPGMFKEPMAMVDVFGPTRAEQNPLRDIPKTPFPKESAEDLIASLDEGAELWRLGQGFNKPSQQDAQHVKDLEDLCYKEGDNVDPSFITGPMHNVF